MSARPQKRPRLAAGTAYHDQISVLDDFRAVHGREGRLLRVGNDILTAPASREVQFTSDSWQDASSWAPVDDPEYALDPDGEWYDEVVEMPVLHDEPVLVSEKPTKKRKKSQVSVSFLQNLAFWWVFYTHFWQRRPHVVWRDLHRSEYLDEMARWEGRGDFLSSTECGDCTSRQSVVKGMPLYRCQECMHPDLVCLACCIKRHHILPLHRINVRWRALSALLELTCFASSRSGRAAISLKFH